MGYVLRNSLAALLTVALALVAVSAGAQNRSVNIMGGPQDSTTMAFAEVLAGVSRSCGYRTVTHETEGALQNLLAVRNNRYTQFGFVQSDVLEYLRAYEGVDPNIAKSIRGMNVRLLISPIWKASVFRLARMTAVVF